MKTIHLNLAVAFLALIFMGCEKEDFNISPSSNITSKQHVLADFQDLEISDPFNVYITFSDTEESLRIEANENLHSLIQIDQNNRNLSIKLKNNTTITGGNVTLNIFISTQKIESIDAQGATHIFLQNQWNGTEAEIDLDGASSLTGTINTDQLFTQLTGACHLDVEGNVDYFEIDATGASTFKGFEFATNELNADLRGGSELSLTVNEKLSIKASGASTVYYKGQGTIENQNLSGNSKILKVE